MRLIASRMFTPNKSGYELSALGDTKFEINQATYERLDGKFVSSRNKYICYSVFTMADGEKGDRPCFVCVTGNRGDRRSSTFFVPFLLPNGIDLACFDFNGLGVSEPDCLSYSLHERHDLNLMVW